MFVISLLFGLTLAGAAVSFTLRAAALPRLFAAQRLAAIESYGFARADAERASLKDIVRSWAERLGAFVIQRSSRLDEAEIRRELVSAGAYDLSPLAFVGYRALAATAIPAFVLWTQLSAKGDPFFILLLMVLSGAAGWVIPSSILHRRAATRLDEIERTLPELIDLLVVTVEAGLGFSSALKTAAARVDGPLGEELRLTLQENNLGLSMQEALSNMLDRTRTPSMRSFVRSVLQGETLGVSIGSIMRNLAIEMRKRRYAAAEEKAHKAPVKMMFPLIFLIFPSMFIVLLFPAAYSFLTSFGGG
jgi:tight adherence protein C